MITTDNPSDDSPGHVHTLSSLDNALKLLDILRVRGDLGVSELARMSGIGKSSAYNMLATLERRGYVRKTARARYFLGEKFFDNDFLEDSSEHIAEFAEPYVKRLMAETSQTAWLAILNVNGRVTALVSEEGTALTRAPRRLGVESEAHCTAAGKVLLAYLNGNMLEPMYRGKTLKRYTSSTITDYSKLKDELALIRELGYSSDHGERYVDYGTLAVPVIDTSGACLAALSIVGIIETLKRNECKYLNCLKEIAADLGSKLSH